MLFYSRYFKSRVFWEKNPDDYLSTDDFYKVYGYCCFYKSDAIVEDQIPIDELTITFVCYHYPRRMTRHLEEKRGLIVMKQEVDSMCQALYELFKDQFEQMAEERAAEMAEQMNWRKQRT